MTGTWQQWFRLTRLVAMWQTVMLLELRLSVKAVFNMLLRLLLLVTDVCTPKAEALQVSAEI